VHELGCSLQANQKAKEGGSHLDRRVKRCLADKQPVISVGAKKKWLVGDFKNGGQELRPKGNPEPVRLAHNTGWVSAGVDHDTAALPWKASGPSGGRWGNPSIPRPNDCSSLPMLVGATVADCGAGPIAATATTNGLKLHSELDTHTYPPGIKVTDNGFVQVRLRPDKFHGEWNYEIRPSSLKK
jgi:hypothetical protein